MKIEKLKMKEYKAEKRQYLKDQKAKIREQMQREIEGLKDNPKLKEISESRIELQNYNKKATAQINENKARLLKEIETLTTNVNKYKTAIIKAQNYEKATRSDIAKQIKEVRAKYKAKLDIYSPKIQKRMVEERRLAELAEKQKAIREKETERIAQEISGKKISAKSLKTQLKKENIQPYPNQEVVNQIKNLKGSTLEVAQQSKNIFLKEMGFNPELVKVRYATEAEVAFQDYGMAFEPISGKLLISPNYKGSNLLTSSAIRHELDHFQLFANLCKSMGVENFKKMMFAKYPKATAEMFNTEFWNKVIQNAKVMSPAEVTKYTKAFKEYELPGLFNNDLLTKVNYFANPIETRAYDIQASIGKSLNFNSKDLAESTVMSHISRRILSAIEKFEQKTGKNIDKDYFEKTMETEILKVQGNEIDPINVLNNVLKKLESM